MIIVMTAEATAEEIKSVEGKIIEFVKVKYKPVVNKAYIAIKTAINT